MIPCRSSSLRGFGHALSSAHCGTGGIGFYSTGSGAHSRTNMTFGAFFVLYRIFCVTSRSPVVY